MTAPLRIVCSGYWHDDNAGDGAIAEGTATLLRERWPNAAITYLSLVRLHGPALAHSFRHLRMSHPTVAVLPALLPDELTLRRHGRGAFSAAVTSVGWLVRLLPVVARISLSVPRAEPAIDDADLLVVLGGSDVYDNPAVAAPFSLGRLLTVLYPAWVAGRRGIPVALFGHTLGPFPRRVGRALARRLLPPTAWTSTRERPSLAVAAELGLDRAVAVPDVAFAVRPRATPMVNSIRLGQRSVGLVVRHHPHTPASDDRTLAEFARIGRALLASGAAEHVAVVVQARGPTAVEDDREMSRRLVAALPAGRATLVDDDLSPSEFAALYGRLRLVVTVRLHAAILAMAAGTPAFAVGYFSTKSSGVMEAVGAPDAWCEHEDFTADVVMGQLDELLSSKHMAVINANVASFRQQLRDEVARWGVPRPTLAATAPPVRADR